MILQVFDFYSGKFSIYDNEDLVESLDHSFWNDKQGIKYELLALIEDQSITLEEGIINIPIDLIY